MDDQDDKGYVGYLRLVKAQRDEGVEYVKTDEGAFAQYAAGLTRQPGAQTPADLSMTEAQQQAAYVKVSAWKAVNAKTQQSRTSVLMPDGVPPLAPKKRKEVPIPRQVSQHHQLFEDIYQQVSLAKWTCGTQIPWIWPNLQISIWEGRPRIHSS